MIFFLITVVVYGFPRSTTRSEPPSAHRYERLRDDIVVVDPTSRARSLRRYFQRSFYLFIIVTFFFFFVSFLFSLRFSPPLVVTTVVRDALRDFGDDDGGGAIHGEYLLTPEKKTVH